MSRIERMAEADPLCRVLCPLCETDSRVEIEDLTSFSEGDRPGRFASVVVGMRCERGHVFGLVVARNQRGELVIEERWDA